MGGIRAGSWIRATDGIRVAGGIRATSGIRATGEIRATDDIAARSGIRAGSGIRFYLQSGAVYISGKLYFDFMRHSQHFVGVDLAHQRHCGRFFSRQNI